MADIDGSALLSDQDAAETGLKRPIIPWLGVPRATPPILDPNRAPSVPVSAAPAAASGMRPVALDAAISAPVQTAAAPAGATMKAATLDPTSVPSLPMLPNRNDPQYNQKRDFNVKNVLEATGMGLLGGPRLAIDWWNRPGRQGDERFKEDLGEAKDAQSAAETQGRVALTTAQTEEAKARTADIQNPKQDAPKVAFHFPNSQGDEVAVFEDGTTKTVGTGELAKPEDIKAMYAQAVDAAVKAGKDPTQDAGVQRLAKAQQMTEKPDTATGTWSLEEDAQGKPVLLNSKTGETKAAPAGVQKSGTKAKADEAAAKDPANMSRAAQDYANDYMTSGKFTGAGDEALMEKYFELAKPSSGFRMTQPQIEMLTKAQDLMNSVVAKGKHLFTPEAPYFSGTQRQQIVDTMKNLQRARDEAKSDTQGSGGQVFHYDKQGNRVP